LRGHAKDSGLLSVTGFPVSLCPRLAGFAAADWPRRHGQGLAPCPRRSILSAKLRHGGARQRCSDPDRRPVGGM